MVDAVAPVLVCSGVLPRKFSFTPEGARVLAQEAARVVGEQASGAQTQAPSGILRSVYLSDVFGFVMVASFVIALPNVPAGAQQGANIFFWLMDTIVPR